MDWKLALGGLGFVIMMPTRVNYLQRLCRGRVSTHSMTWAIWAVLGAIAFAAQLHGGGAALINTGSATTFCLVVAVIAFVRGDREFSRVNWLTLGACGIAAGLWAVFDTPLWSVCAATLIDVLGYLPVAHKAWRRPHDEGLLIFSVATLTWTLGTAAISQFGLVTTLYPATVAATNGLFALMLVARRRIVPNLVPVAEASVPSVHLLPRSLAGARRSIEAGADDAALLEDAAG